MRIEKSVAVPLPADEVFARVSSLEYVASCLPGATITEAAGDVYQGTLAVRVGPITANYAGRAKIAERDADARRIMLTTSAKDRGSNGGVEADFSVTVQPVAAEECSLLIDADIRLRGLVAQFGRGAVDGIIEALVAEFAGNMATGGGPVADSSPGPGGFPSPGGPAAAPISARADVPERLDALGLLMAGVGPRLRDVALGLVLGAVIGRLTRSRRSGTMVIEVTIGPAASASRES